MILETVVTAEFSEYVRRTRRAVLLFSGGLDSSLLLALAAAELGGGLTALTLTGPHIAPGELAAAWHLARRFRVRHIVQAFDPLELAAFRHNTPERCYVCKKAVISCGWQLVRRVGAEVLWDGTNLDDLNDFRPGLKAASEAGVASPLLELGLGKLNIREMSRRLGLPDKPPQSCLATRFPYDTQLTREDLERLSRAEAWLKVRGFSHVRLRVRGKQAVLELKTEEMARFAAPEVRGPYQALVARLGWSSLEFSFR
ncbi:MAG: ATP-dependent sacrificial sulfur transferase LarE [Deltaproteobacteria bacterium]|nr:ATP-dependent sacrificial sulfur transferase LarE [Deltaproteobacteria bacterium]